MMRAPVIPNGWPSAIAPPNGLSFSASMPHSSRHGHDLGGERLVELDDVDVVDRHAGLLEHAPATAGIGPRPMISGRIAATDGGDDARARLQAELARAFSARHHEHRGGAVVERAGVAGGDGAVRLERRLAAAASFSIVVPGRGPSSLRDLGAVGRA